MRIAQLIQTAWLILVVLLLQACASAPTKPLLAPDDQQQITQLSRDMLTLGDHVDPHEARLAATIAIRHSRELAQQYRISGSAIAHNLKVNLGLRDRGLCIHWTEDLLARLRREQFQTLGWHWAIANYENTFRLEHSSVVVTARGDGIDQGLVLDPWRHSGDLYWDATLNDSSYAWQPYDEVMLRKLMDQAAVENRPTAR